MYSRDVDFGEFIVRENEPGNHLFVSAEGEFEIIVNDKVLGTLPAGKAFGELAILYNCRRTATVRGKWRENQIKCCHATVWSRMRRGKEDKRNVM
jgi:hypothetical protein